MVEQKKDERMDVVDYNGAFHQTFIPFIHICTVSAHSPLSILWFFFIHNSFNTIQTFHFAPHWSLKMKTSKLVYVMKQHFYDDH